MKGLNFSPLILFLGIIGLLSLAAIYYFSTQLLNPTQTVVSSTNSGAANSSTVFYGANTDISNLLPNSPFYVKNSKGQDLIDIAHNLGINLFRVTIINNRYPDKAPSRSDWDYLFNKLNKNHIQVILLPEFLNSAEYTKPGSDELSDNYLSLIKSFINTSAINYNNPAIFGFDIRNEPSLTSNNLDKLEEAAQIVKDKYPNLKITVGSWKVETGKIDPKSGKKLYKANPADGAKLVNIVDYYSLHIYGFDRPLKGPYPDPYKLTTDYLTTVKSYAQNKPILIEEFGAGNGTDINDQETIGNPNLQARTYEGVYKAVEDMHSQGVLGALAWLLYPRTHDPDGWTIIDDNGNHLYPAAYVLQKHATGNSDQSVDLSPSDSANYIYRNSDNNKTVNLKVGDTIGLALNLDKTASYMLLTNNTNVSAIEEPIMYYSTKQYYKAVIKIVGKGTDNLIVTTLPNCQNNSDCSTAIIPKFKLNISVKD